MLKMGIFQLVLTQVPHCAIVADADYGTDGGFRGTLRQWKEPYVVAVIPSDFAVVPEDTPIIPAGTQYACGTLRKYPGFPRDIKPHTTDVIAREIPDQDWKTVEWSEGNERKVVCTILSGACSSDKNWETD